MFDFWISLQAIAAHPLGMIAMGSIVAAGAFTALKVRRLGRIIEHLRSLPANKRRYVLERQYRLYPGTKRLPLGFVRSLRRRYFIVTATFTGMVSVVILGFGVQQSVEARAIAWTLDESGIRSEQYGYVWPLEIRNNSTETLGIDDLNLIVLKRVRHPETDRRRPDYGPVPASGASSVTLGPDIEIVPFQSPMGQVSVEPGQVKILRFNIVPDHAPTHGWIYDVRLEATWSATGIIGYRKWSGRIYRLGWPGTSRFADQGTPVDPDAPPMADEPAVAE